MFFKGFTKTARCWSGYKPVKGKKAFSPGSCEKIAVSTDAMARALTNRALKAGVPAEFKDSTLKGMKMTLDRAAEKRKFVEQGLLPMRSYRQGMLAAFRTAKLPKPAK